MKPQNLKMTLTIFSLDRLIGTSQNFEKNVMQKFFFQFS